MKVVTSLVLQGVLVSIALAMTILRCWIRLRFERRKLTLPDYIVWGGFVFTLAWFLCSAIALHIQLDHPLEEQNGYMTDSVPYLVTVFIATYCFDLGSYFPKASILAFYWWLIPLGFRRLRVALHVGIVYTACAFMVALLMDTLIAGNISNNWSIENQQYSAWNSVTAVVVNWCLNWTTDLLVFIIPFFIISCLQLRKLQKIGLCGVFSLGLINIVLSLTRFIIFKSNTDIVDDASGNLWYTAELATATIVVSLPALKPLLMKATPNNTSNQPTSAYGRSLPARSSGQKRKSHAFVEAGKFDDDEIELVMRDSMKSSLSPTRTQSEAETYDGKDVVKVTSEITVFQEAA